MTAAPAERRPRRPRGLRTGAGGAGPPFFGGSVRTRLVLLFFAITSAAIGFVYLYVVPQLNSSLTAERLTTLEQRAIELAPRIERELGAGLGERELRAAVQRVAADADARVTLLGVREGRPSFVISDSELEVDALAPAYRPALGAILSGAVRSGVETLRGGKIGQTAVPISLDGEPVWVAVLSTPLDDVEANVGLIRRQILIAGAIALLLALAAGWFAARAHSERLRRLERAAEQVADGNFAVPIPIDSEDEVGQLARSFDEMQRRLAQLDSARREFIANASHELRTPIASLGGFLELLEEEDIDPESRREFLTTMRGQIDRLTRLTVDLLDLSKLDADAIELSAEPVDLAALAKEAAGEFSAVATEGGVEVVVDAEGPEIPLVHADSGRTLQILRILLDNAIKHTPRGTKIMLTVDSTNTSGRAVVTDTGPGIDPGDRDRVFDRFYTYGSSGSGLGLAIGRELARLMDGELEVASRRGRTAFTLTLPLSSEGARLEGARS